MKYPIPIAAIEQIPSTMLLNQSQQQAIDSCIYSYFEVTSTEHIERTMCKYRSLLFGSSLYCELISGLIHKHATNHMPNLAVVDNGRPR